MMTSRNIRRMQRAEAEHLAGLMARSCLGYGRGQASRQPVADRRAVLALERAFTMLLRRGGEPYVSRLTDEAALAFPGTVRPDASTGARPWLAVGIDLAGQATFAVRWVAVPGAGPSEEAEVAEQAMLAALDVHLAIPGFPAARAAQ